MLYDRDRLRNYLVNDDGLIEEYQRQKEQYSEYPYRLYRFLTELEDILNSVTDELAIIRLVIPKIRKLLTECYWLQTDYHQPSGKVNCAVKPLYEDLDYPLTIQNVVWLPQQVSSIYNHGTWGIVGVISGQEKNKLCAVIQMALNANFNDFEDGIQYSTAICNNIEIIVTRNSQDFSVTVHEILTPFQLIQKLT